MATKRTTREATLDDLLSAGVRYRPLEEAAASDTIAEPPSPSGLRRVGDVGLSMVKGAIGVPEAAVGMADLVTGGRVGKFLENEGGAIGFRPQQARQQLDQWLSPQQQAANEEVNRAQGVVDTGMAALRNPSVIGHAVVESVPLMLGGGVIGRALMKAAPIKAVVAGSAGEGIVGAGMSASQIRQETPDRLLTPTQASLAAASGLATGALGYLGGRVAQKMGLVDIDTLIAGKAAPHVNRGFVRQVLQGAVAEGILEELPQSVQEQVAQNLALDRPLDEGVDKAIVLGTLAGMAMGGGGQVVARSMGDEVRQNKLPESGPLTRAANAPIEEVAKAADAAAPAAVAPSMPPGVAINTENADPALEPTISTDLPSPTAASVPDVALSGSNYTVSDAISADGPAPETVRLVLRGDGSAAIQRDNGDVIDISNMIRAGFTVERAIAQSIGDDTTGNNVSRSSAAPAAQPAIPGAKVDPDTALTRMERQLQREDAMARFGAAQQEAAAVEPAPASPDPVASDAAPQPEPTDIGRADGQPFASRFAASKKLKSMGDGYVIASVSGGYVLRKGSTDVADAGGDAGRGAVDAGRGDRSELLRDGEPGALAVAASPAHGQAVAGLEPDGVRPLGSDDAVAAAAPNAAPPAEPAVATPETGDLPPQGGAAPSTRLQPVADSRLDDQEMRAELDASKADIGWQQIGGRIIRDPRTAIDPDSAMAHLEGDVVGRTPWLGSDLWRNRPVKGGRVNEDDARDAIDKALKGAPMTAKQRRWVEHVLDSTAQRWSDQERQLLSALDDAKIEAEEAEDAGAVERFWQSVAEIEAQEERDGIQAERPADTEDAGSARAAEEAVAAVAPQGADIASDARGPAQERDTLELEPQTEADLRAKTEREAAAKKADDDEQKRLATKAKADAQRDEFTLTGSDRPADVAAAAGQRSLLDEPAPEAAPEQSNPTPAIDASADRVDAAPQPSTRNAAVVDARKRLSVLKSLAKCLA